MAKNRMSIKFIGSENFIGNIEKKSQEVQRNIGKIVQETASNIEVKAKQKAAVDTGFMRQEIYSKKINDTAAEAGAKAPYSLWVDKGTRHQAAQPFFTPAVESERTQFKNKIKQVLK